MYRGRNVYKNERVTYNYVTSKSRKNDGSCYKFVYISEENLGDYKEGDNISVETVATGQKLEGNIRILTKAPGFADLKMTREKGQSDLTAFQMRIYLEPQEKIKKLRRLKSVCQNN